MTSRIIAVAAAWLLAACSGGTGGGTGGGSGGSGPGGGVGGGGSGTSGGSGTGGGGPVVCAPGFETVGGCCHTISVTGPWTIFPNFDGGGPNPTVGSVTGSVNSCTESGNSRVIVSVQLLAPDGSPSENRAYGAHVHVAACDAGQGGGHYRNDPDAGASVTNELWLDFTTSLGSQDSDPGFGYVDHTANWLIRTGEAKSVVIHDHTSDSVGVAGPKLVCIDVPF